MKRVNNYIYFRSITPEVITDNRGMGTMRSADPNRRRRRRKNSPKALPPARNTYRPRNTNPRPQQGGALVYRPKPSNPKQPTRYLPPASSPTLEQAVGPRKKSKGGALAIRNQPTPSNQAPSIKKDWFAPVSSTPQRKEWFAPVPPKKKEWFAPVPTRQAQSNKVQTMGGYHKSSTGPGSYIQGLQEGKRTRYKRINLTGGNPNRWQNSVQSNPVRQLTNTGSQRYSEAKKYLKQKGIQSLDLLNKAYRKIIK